MALLNVAAQWYSRDEAQAVLDAQIAALKEACKNDAQGPELGAPMETGDSISTTIVPQGLQLLQKLIKCWVDGFEFTSHSAASNAMLMPSVSELQQVDCTNGGQSI